MIAALGLLGALLILGYAGWRWRASRTPAGLLTSAEAASSAKDWPAALEAWRAVNATPLQKGSTWLAEARAALALGRVGEAEEALKRSTDADPLNPEPWRLRLEVLRVEDRAAEAAAVGWEAYLAVPPKERKAILRDLTLALLADLPDDLARETLQRWSSNEPDARVALLQRMASMPRAGDPDRSTLIEELSERLKQDPSRLAAREALVGALADAGRIEQGRTFLDAWPADEKDARYWRLKGRWDLEYDRKPDQAAEAFATALESLPNDWKTRARLARALQASGRTAEAKQQAELVGRIREVLDPNRLGSRLAKDIENLDDPESIQDIAKLTRSAGLERLADAWLRMK